MYNQKSAIIIFAGIILMSMPSLDASDAALRALNNEIRKLGGRQNYTLGDLRSESEELLKTSTKFANNIKQIFEKPGQIIPQLEPCVEIYTKSMAVMANIIVNLAQYTSKDVETLANKITTEAANLATTIKQLDSMDDDTLVTQDSVKTITEQTNDISALKRLPIKNATFTGEPALGSLFESTLTHLDQANKLLNAMPEKYTAFFRKKQEQLLKEQKETTTKKPSNWSKFKQKVKDVFNQ